MKKIEITFDEKGTHINVNGIGKDEIKSAAYALLHICRSYNKSVPKGICR